MLDGNNLVVLAENYLLTQRGTVDLSTLPPYIPGAATPGGSIVTVPWTASPIFDRSQGTIFEILLTGPTAPELLNMVPGETYLFIVLQDATGGRTFAWPVNVLNVGDVNSASGSITIQELVCDSDGNLRPSLPASFC